MSPTPQTPPTLAEIEAALARGVIALAHRGEVALWPPDRTQAFADSKTLDSFLDELPQLFADAGAYREMVRSGPSAVTCQYGCAVHITTIDCNHYLEEGTSLYTLPATAPTKSEG